MARSNRGLKPARTSSPLVRQLFDVLDASGRTTADVAAHAGLHPVTLSCWKHGAAAPRWDGLENLAQALGYRIVLLPLSASSVSSTDNGQAADGKAE